MAEIQKDVKYSLARDKSELNFEITFFVKNI